MFENANPRPAAARLLLVAAVLFFFYQLPEGAGNPNLLALFPFVAADDVSLDLDAPRGG